MKTPRHLRQRGVSLLFALLTLVAMMMATLALVRSVDTSALLLGNIGFKQDATVTADQATRQAITWLTNNTASLNSTAAANGYYANTMDLAADGTAKPVDATGRQQSSANRQLVDWDGDGCKYTGAGTCSVQASSLANINGNQAKYVIFRLCSKVGDFTADPTITCATPLKSSAGGTTSKEACDYKGCPIGVSGVQPYYRVVVRVQGARNTTSFTETIVHF